MENIEKYLQFSKDNSAKFLQNNLLPICLDINTLNNYEKQHNTTLGIIFENPWFIVLNDLIIQKDGNTFPYMRLLAKNSYTGSVILPFYKNKIVLLKQFRHGTRSIEYEIPRGAFEENLTPLDNAKKELKEEIGQNALNITFLGTTIADTSFGTGEVHLFSCELNEIPTILEENEGISDICLVTKEELFTLINSNTIKDSFTLAAVLKALSKGILA